MAIWWLGTSWGEADLETEPLTVRLPGITRAAFTLLDENQVFFTQWSHLCLGSCMTPFPSMKVNNHLSKIVKKKNWSQSFSPTISSTSRLDQHVHPTAPWDEAPSSPGRTRQEAHRIILGEKRTQLENWKLPHSAAADLRTIFALRENWIVLGQSLIPGMLENCNWTLGGGGSKSSGRKAKKKIYKGKDPLTLTQQFGSVRSSTMEAWPIPLVMWRCPGTLATSMLPFTRKMMSKFWPKKIFGHWVGVHPPWVQLNFTNLEKKTPETRSN